MIPFSTVSLADMDAQEFPDTEWAVEGLIPAGALVLFAGRPKAGKSLMAIDMLGSLSLGEPFLDRATRQTAVVYVAAEDSFGLVRERLRTRFGGERGAPFHLLPADGSFDQTLRLDDDGTTLTRFAETIDALDVGAIVLDPMRELHSAKENDSDAMAMILRPLRQLAHAKGVTIILVHHKNKVATTDATTGVRGSSAIVGSVDVVMTLDVAGDEDDDLAPGQTVTLRAEGRYGPRVRTTARLATGLRWEVANAVPTDGTLVARIPYLLGAKDEPLDADAIAEALGVKKGGTQNALKELVVKGEVVRIGKGTKSAPYIYAHPRVAARMTKDDESGDESPEMAHDESYDEYSPDTQGKRPIRHLSEGHIPPGDDESFSRLPAHPDMTKGDESHDALIMTESVADDLIADAWSALITWASGKCDPFTPVEEEAARIVALRIVPGESLGRTASRVFEQERAWRTGTAEGMAADD